MRVFVILVLMVLRFCVCRALLGPSKTTFSPSTPFSQTCYLPKSNVDISLLGLLRGRLLFVSTSGQRYDLPSSALTGLGLYLGHVTESSTVPNRSIANWSFLRRLHIVKGSPTSASLIVQGGASSDQIGLVVKGALTLADTRTGFLSNFSLKEKANIKTAYVSTTETATFYGMEGSLLRKYVLSPGRNNTALKSITSWVLCPTSEHSLTAQEGATTCSRPQFAGAQAIKRGFTDQQSVYLLGEKTVYTFPFLALTKAGNGKAVHLTIKPYGQFFHCGPPVKKSPRKVETEAPKWPLYAGLILLLFSIPLVALVLVCFCRNKKLSKRKESSTKLMRMNSKAKKHSSSLIAGKGSATNCRFLPSGKKAPGFRQKMKAGKSIQLKVASASARGPPVIDPRIGKMDPHTLVNIDLDMPSKSAMDCKSSAAAAQLDSQISTGSSHLSRNSSD